MKGCIQSKDSKVHVRFSHQDGLSSFCNTVTSCYKYLAVGYQKLLKPCNSNELHVLLPVSFVATTSLSTWATGRGYTGVHVPP